MVEVPETQIDPNAPTQMLGDDDDVDPNAPQLTATGQTLGTLEYMSPEQLMGKQLDGRSDIGMMGVIGLAVMAISLAVEHGAVAEMLVSVAGVAILAFAHWQNMRALRRT